MCRNFLKKRIQPEPFVLLGILTKYNATHTPLLNSADAEQAQSHSKSNSPETHGSRSYMSTRPAHLRCRQKLPAIVKRLRLPITPACFMLSPLWTAHALLIFCNVS